MTAFSALWLPIVLSAVFVFIASNLLWMALPFWHRKDYGRLSNQDAIVDALTAAPSGQYVAPMLDWKDTTPEQRAAAQAKPMAFLVVRNPGKFSFPQALVSYFIYTLIISALVAYLTHAILAPGAQYLRVFRIAGTAAMLAYSFRGIPDSIWYGKPWPVTLKEFIDGIIYGLLTAGTFGWLWPK